MKTLALDVRFGVRTLWRSRGFAATAAVVLALGTGGSTAMFSFLDAVLLRPPDYPHPEQLVAIFDEFSRAGGRLLHAGSRGLSRRNNNCALRQTSPPPTDYR